MTERDVLAARLQAALARGDWEDAEALATLLSLGEHRAGRYLARDQMGTLAAVCRERSRVLGDDPSTPDYRPSTITGR